VTPPYDFPDDFKRAVEAVITKHERISEVTIDQLNQLLPSYKVSSGVIEEVYGRLAERGINIIE